MSSFVKIILYRWSYIHDVEARYGVIVQFLLPLGREQIGGAGEIFMFRVLPGNAQYVRCEKTANHLLL